ncbi:MAG TPA: histidine kinase [Acidimicrobiales bacterium]|jgi:signal transduction histidine kinase
MVSYVLVTIVVVVLVEAFVLGYQVPRLVNEARLQTQVRGTAMNVANQLNLSYPSGVPAGTLLGERGQHLKPGTAQTTPNDSAVIVPAITGALRIHENVTAAVAIARDGKIIASSIPSRYPVGQSAVRELPAGATAAIKGHLFKGVSGGSGSTPFGSVEWTLYGAHFSAAPPGSGSAGTFTYLYLQAPQPTGFINPIRAWDELGSLSGSKPLFDLSYLILIAILPVGVLLGLLVSRGLVSRVHRLERATVAVTDGDYTVTLPTSGRDEVGRLEENFTTMTHQLNSALAAERERATSEARAAERSRIAREIHDAISQHLFGLRMIASGMLRADPDNEQLRAIERITEEALQDTQALLWELRPAGLDGAGLAPALQQICASYRDLGVTIDANLADISVPEPVELALLRVTQEACTNAVRHGNAHQLTVSMARRDGQVELAITDNGVGFDSAASSAGSGLQHIHDRIAELGGTVSIISQPGAGAAVTVRVPAP